MEHANKTQMSDLIQNFEDAVKTTTTYFNNYDNLTSEERKLYIMAKQNREMLRAKLIRAIQTGYID